LQRPRLVGISARRVWRLTKSLASLDGVGNTVQVSPVTAHHIPKG
jgi:hypothetical protein